MKTRFTFALCLLAAAFTSEAQNQITTPAGQPLVIGNQGVKLANLNSNSTTGTANGKVLTVDAAGMIFLAPASSGGGGGSTPWATSGTTISYNAGNVGIGTSSPQQRLDVNGDINIPVGSALRINNSPLLSAPGTGNVFLGLSSGAANTSGNNNLFLGSQSGQLNTSGINNMFVGSNSGGNNTTGERNVFLGTLAGASNNGSKNTFVGEAAGYSNTTGTDNTFLGRESGISNTTGGYNLYIGRATGLGVSAGIGNTFIGDAATSTVAATQYSTAIGEGAKVDCSSCLVLGRAGVNTGINVTSPTAKLHVNAASSATAGVRLENLPTSTGTVFPLVVDGSGNVMRSSTAGAREAAESLDRHWTLTADTHLINSNLGGIMIGTGLTSTPEGYKLYVSDGILTERVKVAVKSTADWRDNVLQDGYKLRSVEEVETFIKANKHLPGVPSAQEMVENGNDLQKTDAVLLEKVEEMMLYIIDLKKQNTQLQKENKEQQQAIQALSSKMLELEKK